MITKTGGKDGITSELNKCDAIKDLDINTHLTGVLHKRWNALIV